ncbi:hypothetical protein GCM10010492_53880 [Saccharothrix mutabilis subsp. mutabilis]|uniref:Uncharacterized protein n=1 Tax=Saccharothrix mutabilis subsp. mutabilis TaxID=66855 RepID=A0ABN0UE02_9PSEU
MVYWVDQVRYEEDDSNHPGSGETENQTCSIELQPTDTPVWPEDESREDEQRAVDHLPPIEPAPPGDVPEILRMFDLRLPKVLTVHEEAGAAPGRRRVKVQIPVTVMLYSDYIVARRLAFTVHLQTGSGDTVAIAYELEPPSDYDESVTPVGVELEVKALDVASAKVKTSLDVKSGTPRVQVGGINTSDCRWIVADQKKILGFEPKVFVEIPDQEQLRLEAGLHIEVHRYLLRAVHVPIHRAYGISRSPHAYVSTTSFTEMLTAEVLSVDDLAHEAKFETLLEFINRTAGPPTRVAPSYRRPATTAARSAPNHEKRRRVLVWGIVALFVIVAALAIILGIVQGV